jgi:hypothetical protein
MLRARQRGDPVAAPVRGNSSVLSPSPRRFRSWRDARTRYRYACFNQCCSSIQADAASSPWEREEDPHWTTVGANERRGVRAISGRAERVYIWVLVRADGEVARQLDVPVADLRSISFMRAVPTPWRR